MLKEQLFTGAAVSDNLGADTGMSFGTIDGDEQYSGLKTLVG